MDGQVFFISSRLPVSKALPSPSEAAIAVAMFHPGFCRYYGQGNVSQAGSNGFRAAGPNREK